MGVFGVVVLGEGEVMGGKNVENQRQYERADSFVSATIHKLHADESLNNEALVLNISAGGLMLLTTFPLNKHDVFGISVDIEGERIIYVDVRVCWKFGDMIGVMFIDLEDADKELLESVIASGKSIGEI